MPEAKEELVSQTTVSCEGKGATSGHPRVFINIDKKSGAATCPYCGKAFRLDPNADVSSGH